MLFSLLLGHLTFCSVSLGADQTTGTAKPPAAEAEVSTSGSQSSPETPEAGVSSDRPGATADRHAAPAEPPPPSAATPPETSEPRFDLWSTRRLTGDWGGLRTDLEDLGFKLSLSYQHQWQQNFRGGITTHNAQRQSGSYDLVFKFDLGKMGLLKNAGFYFKAKGNFGEGINGSKVGALARVNSDVGGDHPVYVSKWWYWQKFLDGKIELRLGRIETVKDLFDVSLFANHEDKDFLNRGSFRNLTIPHGTGTGAFLKIQPIDALYVQAATIDAQSRSRRTGFDTAFHDEAWFVGFLEMGWTPSVETSKGPLPGRYRLGGWLEGGEHAIFKDTLDGSLAAESRDDNRGFYLGLDQTIWKENADTDDKQGLGIFARYGYSHPGLNRINQHWQSGLSYRGLLPTRDNDVFGFAVSQSMLSKQYRRQVNPDADRETVYEWYYLWQITPWCTITPDLQVITNPGGNRDDRDAIVGGVRMRVIF